MPLRLPHRHLAPCPLVPLRHSYHEDFLPSILTSAPDPCLSVFLVTMLSVEVFRPSAITT